MITTERLTIRPIIAEDWPAVRDIWAALSPLPMAQYDKPFDTTPGHVQARIARWAEFCFLAEGAGFEPAWAFALTVFKTAPL